MRRAGLRWRRWRRQSAGEGALRARRQRCRWSDRWLFARIAVTVETVNDALANYRFHEAAQAVYQFFWGDFCDWYIEWVKPDLQNADRGRADVAWKNLFAGFDAALRLLHPFMPFLTEELWHQLPRRAERSRLRWIRLRGRRQTGEVLARTSSR